jgi:hypothetical protein
VCVCGSLQLFAVCSVLLEAEGKVHDLFALPSSSASSSAAACASPSEQPLVWHRIATADLHLSLSKTFTLKHHEILPFVDALRVHLKPFTSSSSPFAAASASAGAGVAECVLRGFEFYTNEQRTRSFVALSVAPPSASAHHRNGHNTALQLIACTNAALTQFSLPTYYEVCRYV